MKKKTVYVIAASAGVGLIIYMMTKSKGVTLQPSDAGLVYYTGNMYNGSYTDFMPSVTPTGPSALPDTPVVNDIPDITAQIPSIPTYSVPNTAGLNFSIPSSSNVDATINYQIPTIDFGGYTSPQVNTPRKAVIEVGASKHNVLDYIRMA